MAHPGAPGEHGAECGGRLGLAFVAVRKRAEMNGHGGGGAEHAVGRHCVRGPQVLLAHVPGRLEASDGEDGQPRVGEASPDLGEVRAPAVSPAKYTEPDSACTTNPHQSVRS